MSSNGDAPAETTGADRSATRFSRDDLAADARELVTIIESVHPDPYRGYGSRVALHRQLEETVDDLPESATVEAFYRLAAPLVAEMRDAHSLLYPPDRDDSEDEHRLPLSVRVVGDGLYVESVADESLTGLLGARLLAVEGEPVGALVERRRRLRGAENRYGALSDTGRSIESFGSLDRLLGREQPPTAPTLRFAVDGDRRERTLTPVSADAESAAELRPSAPYPAGSGPRYRLYEDGDAAVFVPGNLSAYRESLEAFQARGSDRTAERARAAHEDLVGGEPPEGVDELVAALPSMVETLTGLVEEMATAGTRTLFVDLRDNPGGDSQFVSHLAYVLDGWDAVAETARSVSAVKRRTERHRERFGTPAELATAADNPANYDFLSLVADEAELLEQVRARLTSAETFATVVDDGTYEGFYRPEQVVVVTSAGTMSSAFAAAAQLQTLGADLVGVPSGQAPVSYGEAVEEPLSNTGLTARIAGSMYRWVSDPDGDVLPVERELTPDDFDRYDRASDASLRLAFDYAGVTDGDPPNPV